MPRKRILQQRVRAARPRHDGARRPPFRPCGAGPFTTRNLWLVVLRPSSCSRAYAARRGAGSGSSRAGSGRAMLTLAAAGGAASVGGLALPGRCDEVIRVAVVRRCRRRRTSTLGAVALSLFLLGLPDSAAMTPLASVSHSASPASRAGSRPASSSLRPLDSLRLPPVFALPRLSAAESSLASAWPGGCASTPRRPVRRHGRGSASRCRGRFAPLAIFVPLAALGLGNNFALALAFVCASAAAPYSLSRRPARRCRLVLVRRSSSPLVFYTRRRLPSASRLRLC